MQKKILILSNPGKEGADNYCEGVNKDVINYQKFFESSRGGNWNTNEIEHLLQPSKELVLKRIGEMNELDFSIIVFSGHGYSQGTKTFLELQPVGDNDIEVNDLECSGHKRIIITDCCRKPWYPMEERADYAFEHVLESVNELFNTRAFYEQKILEADTMNVVTYSCDLGEVSYDDSRLGGNYSSALLHVATSMEKKNEYGLYESANIVEVHNKAKVIVTRKESDQNPQITKPRTGKYLPFAVV